MNPSDELDGHDIYDNWDQLLNSSSASENEILPDLDSALSDASKGQDYWLDLFQQENFAGMDLMSVHYQPYTINKPEVHQQLYTLKRSFLAELVTHYLNDLRSADLSEESIFYLSKGILPSNWTIHLKYPLMYGGKIEMDNLLLIQCQPFHELIHKYINQQMITPAGVGHPKTLYVPVAPGKVYIPMGEMTGSGGKKKADRSVNAGLTTQNLQQISIKTGGR